MDLKNNFDFESFVEVWSSRGSQLIALCPFHEDRSPSFSCNTETGLWKCFAGCGAGDFSTFRLMADKGKRDKEKSKKNGPRYDWSGFQHVSTHYYSNLIFQENFRVNRFEHPTKGKVFIQEHWSGRGWVKGKCEWELLPYLACHWHRNQNNPLFFVEGEKCADHLHALGLKATTVPGGASGWHSKHLKHFKGHTVIILPDNDDIGREFGNEVFKSMVKSKIDVKLVHLPGLDEGEDVIDWMEKGRSLDDLLEAALTTQE